MGSASVGCMGTTRASLFNFKQAAVGMANVFVNQLANFGVVVYC